MDIVENWCILGGLCSHKLHLIEKLEGIMPEGKPANGELGERKSCSSATNEDGVPAYHPLLQ